MNSGYSLVAGLRGFIQAVENSKPQVALVAVSSFLSGLLEAVFLVFLAKVALAVADGLERVQLLESLYLSVQTTLIVCGVLAIARLLVALYSVKVSVSLIFSITTRVRQDLASAYLGCSWETKQKQPAGALQQLVVTFPTQGATILTQVTGALGGGLSLVAMLGVAITVDFKATGIVVLAVILLSFVLSPLRKNVHQRSKAALYRQMDFANGVSQVGELGLEVHSFGVQEEVGAELDELIRDDGNAQRQVGMAYHMVSPIYVTLAYGAIIGGLFVLSLLGNSSLQSAGAIMLVMLRSLGYGQQIQQGLTSLAQVVPFLTKIRQSIDELSAQTSPRGFITISDFDCLEFRNVSFGYSDAAPVIKDATFKISRGDRVGIVGPSGSGKSTVIELMLGLRSPTIGSVLVNQRDLREVDQDGWSQLVAFVPQTPHLLTGTVQENVAFYRSSITSSDVLNALGRANVVREVIDLPEGIDTHLGERGQQLSGGQRQRITIARALVTAPQLVILDEPTSALDESSEAAVRDSLNTLDSDTTLLIVAHRRSTLEICNRFLVINDGEVRMVSQIDLPSSSNSLDSREC